MGILKGTILLKSAKKCHNWHGVSECTAKCTAMQVSRLQQVRAKCTKIILVKYHKFYILFNIM